MDEEKKATYFSKNRTRLSNERTLLSYLRTALAFFILGAFLIKLVPTNFFITIGIVSIIFGIVILIYGVRRFFHLKKIINKR